MQQSGDRRRAIAPTLVWRGFAILIMLALPSTVTAQTSEPGLPADATLRQLIKDSLAARPELAQAVALSRANEERVSQAGAMPDPMLQVGIQNDGFTSIEIGRMGTSFVSLMAAQTFPWPGKRGLREQVAQLGSSQSMKVVARLRLSTEAEVRREYLELVLVRERLVLVGRLDEIWQRSTSFAQLRYETGGGPQADVLRARLEQSRLAQRRLALLAQERSRVQALDRLSGRPLQQPVDTASTRLRDLANLAPLERIFSVKQALLRSPELAAARIGSARADKVLSLAGKSYYPDLTVSAGFMYRGQLPPMWLATVAGPVPVFSGSKQSRAVAESSSLLSAAQSQVASVEQLLRLRSEDRRAAFSALRQIIDLYEQGLLVQSAATTQSTLAQYQVGKVTFASVLEANAGLIADQEGYLEAIATAQRMLIAEAEVSLAAVGMPEGTATAASAMPGTESAPDDTTSGM